MKYDWLNVIHVFLVNNLKTGQTFKHNFCYIGSIYAALNIGEN